MGLAAFGARGGAEGLDGLGLGASASGGFSKGATGAGRDPLELAAAIAAAVLAVLAAPIVPNDVLLRRLTCWCTRREGEKPGLEGDPTLAKPASSSKGGVWGNAVLIGCGRGARLVW